MELKVTKVPGSGWCVERGDGQFISHLSWDEALGVIANAIVSTSLHGLSQDEIGGFRSYLGNMCWRGIAEPIALIAYQPECKPFTDPNASPFWRIR